MKAQNMMSLAGGALVGVAAMYLLDPATGAERRQYVKKQAGEYLGDAGELLESGWEKVSHKARDVGGAIADKAQGYGGRLGELAQDYGHRLADHIPSNRRIAEDLGDYGKELWDRASAVGGQLKSRAQAYSGQARVTAQASSPIIPVTLTAVSCCAVGAGLMFITDPQRGRARRAWLIDKTRSFVRRTGRSFYGKGRDLANRAYGTARETCTAAENLVDRARGNSPPQSQEVPML